MMNPSVLQERIKACNSYITQPQKIECLKQVEADNSMSWASVYGLVSLPFVAAIVFFLVVRFVMWIMPEF